MTIQPAPMGGKWAYKVNPLQPREILKKPNRKGGRWTRHLICANEESAGRIVVKLQNESDEDE